ncbi:shikimate kinase [Marinoscillum sp.]|uniref:shikimate kinase n=1 Tax=Marinoscillum sp. TaxID=2024838 RepID=UPI0032FA4021
MILYLVGISCIGKTTIGKMLADKIGYSFFDLDREIQDYYKKPIERIQDEYLTMNGYRKKASVVLDRLFSKNIDSVVSGTPSGLKFSYLQVYKRHRDKELLSICLNDSFENVLDRLTFYDKDSNPIAERLDESKKKRYLKEIQADYNYFKDSYKRADFQINIEDVSLENIPDMIIKAIGMNESMSATNNVHTK